MGHARTTLRESLSSGRPLGETIANAFVPPGARRRTRGTAAGLKRHAALRSSTEPEAAAVVVHETARTKAAPARGPTKNERRISSLGPSGRQHARVGAVPRGKRKTAALAHKRSLRVGKKTKSLRGSPSAKRRVANRRAYT